MTSENHNIVFETPEDFKLLLDTMRAEDWVGDIAEMHDKFGVNVIINELPKDKLLKFLKFRIDFLQEELDEMREAYAKFEAGEGTIKDADDTVDALIDLCVVAIGTLNAFDIFEDTAWKRVFQANIVKEPGINPNRPNELGLPDLIKPEGWTAPTHADNIGLLWKLVKE